MNIVMNDSNEFIEIHGTTEEKPFSYDSLKKLIVIGQAGIENIISTQKKQRSYE